MNTVTPMKIGAQVEGRGVSRKSTFWSRTQSYELGPDLRRDNEDWGTPAFRLSLDGKGAREAGG